MPRIARERDRVLRRAARMTGLISSGSALVFLSIPTGVGTTVVLVTAPLILLMIGCQYLLGRTGALRWALAIVALGNIAVLVVGLASRPEAALNVVEEAVIDRKSVV